MLKNSEGQIALKYYQPRGQYIDGSGLSSGTLGYVFTVRANISMAWISPIDLTNILNRRRKGCGHGGAGCGGKSPAFTYANEADVRRWTNNGGR